MRLLIESLFLLFFCSFALCQYQPNWDSLDSRPLPKWYDESKIGIFLHWGLYSVPAFGENSEWMWAYWRGKGKDYVKFMTDNFKPNFTYQEFGPMFTAELYDPDQWADLFQAAGAKYVVLTSKHHEGFTMWPSKHSWNWNAMDLGPRRDLLGDLAKSVRNRTDLRFGLYYSLYEWYNTLYLQDKANKFTTQKYVQLKMIPEMLDIVNTYRPEVIWVDGDWEATDTYFNSTNFLAWLYNQSPVKDTVAVNDRWGKGLPCKHGGYYTCTDKFNPGVLQTHKWENAMTLDLNSWGYRKTQLSNIMSIERLIATLAQTVSCGGNILIDVGPTSDGRIIPIFEERLRQLGTWLKVNGDAIYKSSPWKYQNDSLTPGVWYTERQDLEAVYAIVLEWPKGSVLQLGSVKPTPIMGISMLGVPGILQWTELPSGTLNISLPRITPDVDPSKWAWVLKLDGLLYPDNEV